MVESNQSITSYAGLIPVLHYLKSINFSELFKDTVIEERDTTSFYKLSDIVIIVIIGIIGGAKSIDDIVCIWNCPVLRKLSG